VATGGFEPQTPDASGSSKKHLGDSIAENLD